MSPGDGEQWRPAPGWEGLYEVSDLGQVRSLDRICADTIGRHRQLRGQLLQPRYNPTSGYAMVALTRRNQKKHYAVHTLVALAFLGPRPGGQEVRHRDGDPANPTLANLSYSTHGDNVRDKRRHGTDHNVNKTHCLRGHALDDAYVRPGRPNRQCRICHNKGVRDRRAARKAARLLANP